MPNARKNLVYESVDAACGVPGCRAMAKREIYTRAYSKSSVGRLISGKGPRGSPLSSAALLVEFQNHANIRNREPTALVSASYRIVDTVKRAIEKHVVNGESKEEIWIAFIEVLPPAMNETAARIHPAKELARKCRFLEPNLHSHEVVFEWSIPEKYVLHEVSLETLLKRGLQPHCFLQPSTEEASTEGARRYIASKLQGPQGWDIGLSLGFFARDFGARAPLEWISYQLFYDCVRTKVVREDMVELYYAHGYTDSVDLEFFCDLEDGMHTSLYLWWLADSEFQGDYAEFDEWRAVTEDSMTEDLIEFWQTWHGCAYDERTTVEELSAEEKSSFDKVKTTFWLSIRRRRRLLKQKL